MKNLSCDEVKFFILFSFSFIQLVDSFFNENQLQKFEIFFLELNILPKLMKRLYCYL